MNNQTLGAMIASLRKENGMTQLELAEKMGVTDKAVSKWERDLSYPDVSSLPKLSEIFGVSLDRLIQVKLKHQKSTDEKNIHDIIPFIFKTISLAMGIAVMVLSLLKAIDMYSGFFMLGLGLTCAGICFLTENSKND